MRLTDEQRAALKRVADGRAYIRGLREHALPINFEDHSSDCEPILVADLARLALAAERVRHLTLRLVSASMVQGSVTQEFADLLDALVEIANEGDDGDRVVAEEEKDR